MARSKWDLGPVGMRLVVTGTRRGRADVWYWLDRFVARHGKPALVVCGDGAGVDREARRWAHARGLRLHTEKADWAGRGRAAGPERNKRMVLMASPGDWCLAFPDAQSRGTWDCVERARKRRLETVVLPEHVPEQQS